MTYSILGSRNIVEFGTKSHNKRSNGPNIDRAFGNAASQRTSSFNNAVGQSVPWRSIQVASSTDLKGNNSNKEKYQSRFASKSIRKSHQLEQSQQSSSTSSYRPISERLPQYKSVETSPFLNNLKKGVILRFVIFPFLVLVCSTTFMVFVDQTIRPSPSAWRWSGERKLNGRKCVLNFFVDKHSKDEYNPDYDIDSQEHNTVGGTHWTSGQLKVITRFISSVAGTFRSKIHLHQHLIFTGTRDGGYLAEKAFQSWPKRGSRFSELHIIAADTNLTSEDSLGYTYLQSIEERFKGNAYVSIYDRHGLAGHRDEIDEVDDDEVEEENSNFPKFDLNNNMTSLPYPNLLSLLPDTVDEEGRSRVIVPYLHVDGLFMADQFEILMSSVPLLKTKAVVAVGIEHSPDMNVMKLIKFFDSVDYKTFFLGSRQLARVDNLCPETLYDVLRHPNIKSVQPKWSTRLLNYLGVKRENMQSNTNPTPPFYVALPRGRLNREEMAIQHAYDLFGGFDGEKEIKTANDRSTFKK